jgi:hypothetical protein
MTPDFETVLSKMEPLFQKLTTAERLPFSRAKEFPEGPGLYLLSEANENLYVGRSSRGLRNRLKGHGAGTHFSSSFAFLLARDETGMKATYKQAGSRAELMSHPVFRPAFDRAVERIKCMDVRLLELVEDHEQYLLELYAALRLKTKHNHFPTS